MEKVFVFPEKAQFAAFTSKQSVMMTNVFWDKKKKKKLRWEIWICITAFVLNLVQEQGCRNEWTGCLARCHSSRVHSPGGTIKWAWQLNYGLHSPRALNSGCNYCCLHSAQCSLVCAVKMRWQCGFIWPAYLYSPEAPVLTWVVFSGPYSWLRLFSKRCRLEG